MPKGHQAVILIPVLPNQKTPGNSQVGQGSRRPLLFLLPPPAYQGYTSYQLSVIRGIQDLKMEAPLFAVIWCITDCMFQIDPIWFPFVS